ncbi:NAD-dependent epimerase/dehydratase family protein [Leifsonia aquatica]|uniref:Nucleoside-diphosphate-sugar epimerase n=2 Tax=Leifsonia aquatica TaxID=144185 RepID=A0A7W4UST9_LEIAQ|nr:nucleoside-diphosphate-sugar epimerase [Leifsonia aquatica]
MTQEVSAVAGDQLAGHRILVTGGAGLIGRTVVDDLVARGAEVSVLEVGEPRGAAKDAVEGRWLVGSVSDARFVRDAVEGMDAVVHLAGRAGLDQGEPAEIYEANALGTFLMLDAAAQAGARKVVYASSINASGLPLNSRPVLPTRYPWDETEPADIDDAYSLSKQANEAAGAAVAARYGLAVTGIRFPLVRDITVDDGTVFAQHIRRAMREDPRRQACEGWTYLDVRDAARAVFAALTHSTPAAPGILVANPLTYLRQDTETALRRFAPEVPRASVPGRHVPVVLARSEDLLGFRASITLDDLGAQLLVDLDDAEGLA